MSVEQRQATVSLLTAPEGNISKGVEPFLLELLCRAASQRGVKGPTPLDKYIEAHLC